MQRIVLFQVAVFLVFMGCSENQTPKDVKKEISSSFDWQGHRGARGLLPENTIPSFLKALEYPVTTLELDVVVSKDRQVIISHEPWMSASICSNPDGTPVAKNEEEQLVLFNMTYEEIKKFDCGSRGNERFPEQRALPAWKPSLRDVVAAVREYCERNRISLPRFNIEIKSQPEWDGIKTPGPEEFARLVLREMEELGINHLSNIQSFDIRPLQVVKEIDSNMTTALLVDNMNGVEANLKELGYQPEIYSPYYRLVTANVVKTVHEKGMLLIPWTVNDTATMRSLIDLGVDGIITDYPDRVLVD